MLLSRQLAGTSSRRISSYYDIVVVGGGMVGNAMACSIAASKHLSRKSVLLLEGGTSKGLKADPTAVYSNRVSAVNPASVQFFKNLHIWDKLVSYRVKNVKQLQVLDSCSLAEISFDQPLDNQEIAYIVENDAITGALVDALKGSNVHIKDKCSVKKCSIPSSLGEAASIELESGERIDTSLLIGADGARSKVRESMGVNYTSWNYDQSGVVATLSVECPSSTNDIAWQRFTPLGPIALLPLSSSLSSLVWTTSTEEAKRLVSIPQDQFIDELNHLLNSDEQQNSWVNQSLFAVSKLCPSNSRTRSIPPQVVSLQTDTRAAFPLGFGHAHSYIATRAALVGDAAHRMHPLAGQGVNVGWHDVVLLANVLNTAASQGGDLGAVSYLGDYDSSAQRHNLPVMVSVDWLNRLYRTDATPLVALRSFGLTFFDKLAPVKDFLVHHLSTPPFVKHV